MTDLRADSMTGEQFVFEERTADPGSTVEGERWLRTDLNSGDKLATLRVDVGGSTLDVPVFPTGTSEDGVTEALRVRVGSQTGYIPAIADTSAAGFPQLRLQHDGQVYGYHNEQGVFAFFDVAISSTNSPVNEGSDLNVDYSVQNTGFSANNTQDIRLQIDTVEEDRDSNITLSPGSSTTGTLTWTTPSSSAGTYNAAVLSDDDTASTSVTVEEFTAIPDSVVSRPADNNDASTTGNLGIEISISQDWPSIGCQISSNVSGFSTARIYDSSESFIDSVNISSLSAGDTFTFDNVNLTSGSNYILTINNDGSTYTTGYFDSPSTPYTSSDGNLSIVDGRRLDSGTTSALPNIVTVGDIGF